MINKPTFRKSVLTFATFILMLSSACSAEGGEAYYMLVFGSQQIPNRPNYAHSFATFVRVTWPGDDACPATANLEAHTISWLPANLIVRTNALFPERGHNFGLEETLCYAYRNGERVSMWGPQQIQKELYDYAMRQVNLLESGQVRYKADDMGRRSNRVSNCIHAVSSMTPGIKLRVAEPGFGEMASFAITKKFRPWVMGDEVHAWVGSAWGSMSIPLSIAIWCHHAAAPTLARSFGSSVVKRT